MVHNFDPFLVIIFVNKLEQSSQNIYDLDETNSGIHFYLLLSERFILWSGHWFYVILEELLDSILQNSSILEIKTKFKIMFLWQYKHIESVDSPSALTIAILVEQWIVCLRIEMVLA